MVRLEIDSFSGSRIYPGKGRLFVARDSRVHRFGSSKEESLFLQGKNPRKISWTSVYRKANRKGITEETARKRSRKTVKAQRGVVGLDLKSILAKRNEKPEVRKAQRQQDIADKKAARKEHRAQVKAQRAANPPPSKGAAQVRPKGGLKIGSGTK